MTATFVKAHLASLEAEFDIALKDFGSLQLAHSPTFFDHPPKFVWEEDVAAQPLPRIRLWLVWLLTSHLHFVQATNKRTFISELDVVGTWSLQSEFIDDFKATDLQTGWHAQKNPVLQQEFYPLEQYQTCHRLQHYSL